jgi:glycosyltransferase involved in cell wall biosynthesis
MSGAPAAGPEISVIVPVFDKAEALPHVIAAFARQRPLPDAEYIFVDDASRDSSVAVLKDLAAQLPGLRIIENAANAGPAIRLNQGAADARGRLLCLLDSDEIVAPDAVAAMARLMDGTGADMAHGKVARGAGALAQIRTAPLGPAPEFSLSDAPLATVAAGRGYVRMAWMVDADLFRRAGGCDPRIFIQDESLPLRLALHARRFLDLRAAVTSASAAGGHLSADRRQQHHDRFFAAWNLLCDNPGLPADVAAALARKCFSAARRAAGAGLEGHRVRLFLDYVLSRTPLGLSRRAELSRIAGWLRAMPGVRRPGSP